MVNIAFDKNIINELKLFIENIKNKWKLDKSFIVGCLGRNGDWSNVIYYLVII